MKHLSVKRVVALAMAAIIGFSPIASQPVYAQNDEFVDDVEYEDIVEEDEVFVDTVSEDSIGYVQEESEGIPITEEYFPDPNFREILKESYYSGGDNFFSPQEINKLNRLSFYDDNVESIEGIEYLPEITKLEIHSDKLKRIDLSKNPKISYIKCEYSVIENIKFAENNCLESLWAESNNISEIDLSNCKKLRYVNLSENKLTKIIFDGESCDSLYLSNNSDLDSIDVSNMKYLTSLYISGTNISELDLKNNVCLNTLYCYGTNISEIDLSNNHGLKKLSIYDCKLESLDISNTAVGIEKALNFTNDWQKNAGMIKEYKLNKYQYKKLMDTYPGMTFDDIKISVVEDNDEEPLIAIDENNFEDAAFAEYIFNEIDLDKDGYLSMYERDAVSDIYMSDNPIKSLKGIEHFDKLKGLFCLRCGISEIDLSGNPYITDINCSENNIKKLDLSKNKLLVYLECNDNQLESLDLSNNKLLTDLECIHNNLDVLDITPIESLIHARVGNQNDNKKIKLILDENQKNAVYDIFVDWSNVEAVYHTHNNALKKWTFNEEEHWMLCDDDNMIFERGEHAFDGVEGKEKCSVCGYSKSSQGETPGNDDPDNNKHEHYGTCTDAKDATCENDGCKEYYSCDCGKVFEDAECTKEISNLEAWKKAEGKIAAKGHAWDAGRVTKEKSYKENGTFTYTCDNCGATKVDVLVKYGCVSDNKLEMAVGAKVDVKQLTADILKEQNKSDVSIDKIKVSSKKCASVNKAGILKVKKAGQFKVELLHKKDKKNYETVYSFMVDAKKVKLPKKYYVMSMTEGVDFNNILKDAPANQQIKWSVDNKDLGKGLFEGSMYQALGESKVRVVCSIGDGDNAAYYKMTVYLKYPYISAKNNAKIPVGKKKTITLKNINADTEVKWTVSDASKLQIISDDGHGKIKVKGIAAGEVILYSNIGHHQNMVTLQVK